MARVFLNTPLRRFGFRSVVVVNGLLFGIFIAAVAVVALLLFAGICALDGAFNQNGGHGIPVIDVFAF